MTWRRVALAVLVLWIAFDLGTQWGAGREREVVAERVPAPAAPPTLRPVLRCSQAVEFDSTNTPRVTERVWTQAEAEARYHTAAQWLRTAEEAGVWSDRGRRAVMLAVGQLLEVVVCVR